MNDHSVLKELRLFEKEQEEKLERIQANSLEDIEKAKRDIDKKLEEEKEKEQKKREGEIEKAKVKAKDEAEEVIQGYKRKIAQLEKKSSKNVEKAVDKVFSIILGKNV